MSYEDSGEYPVIRRRKPSKDQLAEWLTWVIRLMIPAICWLAFRQNAAMEELQMTVAKMSVEETDQSRRTDDNARQIEGLWRQVRDRAQ